MKPQKTLFLTLIIFSLLFSGCFSSWQEDTGTIILNLGNNGRKSGDFPPEDTDLNNIKYEVTFTGANDEFTLNSNGSQTVKKTVTSGEWKITVKAYTYSGSVASSPVEEIYAFGRETVIVKPGQYNPVTVKMSNKGVVELNFVKLISNNDTELPVENASFELELEFNYKPIEKQFNGKGPHFIELVKGQNYSIKITEVSANYFPSESARVSGLYINGSGDIKSNGYSFNINPGDHKVLSVTIKVDYNKP